MKTHEVYQMVTNQIIEHLENHLETWDKPWITISRDGEPPRNPMTQNYYRGINEFLLSILGAQKSLLRIELATYAKVKRMNGYIKKGAKSIPILFYKDARIDKNKKYYKPDTIKTMNIDTYTDKGIQRVGIVKLYRVFNICADTEGLEDHFYEVDVLQNLRQEQELNEAAEELIRSSGATIIETLGNRACFDSKVDTITIPQRAHFEGEVPFYDTVFHELSHFISYPRRLNLDYETISWGDSGYAKNEQVAELSAAFICASLNYQKMIPDNNAYFKGWLKVLKDYPKAVVQASSRAQKIADYIIGGEGVSFSSNIEGTQNT